MAVHGSIGAYDSSQEDWSSYVERLEEYFIANEVTTEVKMKAVFISNCGPQTYNLLKSLIAPAKPAQKSYEELVKALKDHWQPKPSLIVQRYYFHSRNQKDNETIAEFVAELRRLSEHCEFNDLEDMLRDRLVCGVRDTRIQKKLLAEATLTFKKAFETALAMEVAEQNVKDLHISSKPTIHKVQQHTQQRPTAAKLTTTAPSTMACYRCGRNNHSQAECRYKDIICRQCKKRGHIARACKRKKPELTHKVTEDKTCAGDDPEYTIFSMTDTKNREPYVATPCINSKPLRMEIDTGASLSLISEETYRTHWKGRTAPAIQPTDVNLRTYTGGKIEVAGKINVTVKINEQNELLRLIVVKGNGPSLMGLDWLRKLKLDWACVKQITRSTSLGKLLQKHDGIFQDELGRVKGLEAKIFLKSDAQPKFCRARTVPFALRTRVEEELERLVKAKVIEPVNQSEWATPIVPIVKTNGDIRICGDFKVTLNKAIHVDSYPLPKIDDLLGSLAGGKTFSTLDLAHAYMQLTLEQESKSLTTINTHKGLYRYNRLPFGIASAPAMFQRTMETLLRDIPNVSVYIDDILITGKTEEEHLEHLEAVLSRLEESGMRLKKEKCMFMTEHVEYLGHVISNKGIKPLEKNIKAIIAAPTPGNVSQLKSFLGMVTYYLKFVPNLSNTLAPLYILLQKNAQWKWGSRQTAAFENIKKQLTAPPVLAAFDPEKDIVLSCDASPYGIGAVLAHREVDGSERPIAYTSRSLAPAEKRYSQLDKEALALIFGVKKFHNYIYGRRFVLMSDHKPLKHILGETSVPQMASARLQRWALLLGAYSYVIQYRPGKENSTADALSRIPLLEAPQKVPVPGELILLMDNVASTPMDFKQIAKWTEHDPLLSRVRNQVLSGWSYSDDPLFQPYQNRKNELSVHSGCILWGSRVIVPNKGRKQTLELLHEGHPGISRTKARARSLIWWPTMDQEIESLVQHCPECQKIRHSEKPVPFTTWEAPKGPWRRIHIDYAGPFHGRMFLLAVDAYSKWLEVAIVNTANTTSTIEKLRYMFATHGLPDTVVSDNGSVFTSEEFQTFTSRNGIRHIRTAPYHPSSNGQAERMVQTFKEGIKKSSPGTIDTQLARFLFNYRTTTHSTTGFTPAELIMNRRLRTKLDRLHPDLSVSDQLTQRQVSINGQKGRTFMVEERVYIQDLPAKTWRPAIVKAKEGKGYTY